jgi:hypothetical protein
MSTVVELLALTSARLSSLPAALLTFSSEFLVDEWEDKPTCLSLPVSACPCREHGTAVKIRSELSERRIRVEIDKK